MDGYALIKDLNELNKPSPLKLVAKRQLRVMYSFKQQTFTMQVSQKENCLKQPVMVARRN
jgi:hypothetical protein